MLPRPLGMAAGRARAANGGSTWADTHPRRCGARLEHCPLPGNVSESPPTKRTAKGISGAVAIVAHVPYPPRRGRPRHGVALAAALAVCLAVGVTVGVGLPGHASDRATVTLMVPESHADLARRLRNASLLIEAQAQGVSDPQELFATARADYGRLVSVLYGQGHYSVDVSIRFDGREVADFSPLDEPRAVERIVVQVDPGPRFSFGQAQVRPLAPGTELPAGFATGAPARSDTIRDAAEAAVDGWRAVGHAKAQPDAPRIIADHRSATLDADLAILPGPRLRFGAFNVQGMVQTREERLRAIAGFPTGETYSPEALETSARRLRRSGAFSSVSVAEAAEPNPDGTLDITTTVVEAPLRRIGGGAELDTQDGLTLGAFWMHRNLLGGAERLRIDGEVSGIGGSLTGMDYRFSARFTRPATFTPETTLSMGVRAETVDRRGYNALRFGGDVMLTRFFSETLTGEGGAGFLIERANDATGRTTRAVAGLPGALIFDNRDDARDATSGHFLRGDAMPFLGVRRADAGLRLALDGRSYLAIDSDARYVLAGRVQAGSVIGAQIDRVPRDMLFYSGGGGTVRGQPFRSLGVSRNGVLTGGRSFAALSGEIRAGITDNLGVVGFADTGFVGAGSFGTDGAFQAGAGLGVRYDTAIGPLRVDVGVPVRGATSEGLQLYIGIGQAF